MSISFAAAHIPIRALDKPFPDGRRLTVDVVAAPARESGSGYWRGYRLRAELDGLLLAEGFTTPVFPPPVTPDYDESSQEYKFRYTPLRTAAIPSAAWDGRPVLAEVPEYQMRTRDYVLLTESEPVGRIDIHCILVRANAGDRPLRMATLRVCLTSEEAARFDQAREQWRQRPGELARSAAPHDPTQVWEALTWKPAPGMLINLGEGPYVVLDVVATHRIPEDGRCFGLDAEDGFLYDVRVRDLTPGEREAVISRG